MISNNELYLTTNEAVTFDPNYRYKSQVPLFEIRKVKGSQITYFTNSSIIATSIQFNEQLLIKIIGNELSCRSGYDDNYRCGFFKGVFEKQQINNIICYVIQNYLICQVCDYPELELYEKKGCIKQNCKSCGKKRYVKNELEITKIYQIIVNYLNK